MTDILSDSVEDYALDPEHHYFRTFESRGGLDYKVSEAGKVRTIPQMSRLLGDNTLPLFLVSCHTLMLGRPCSYGQIRMTNINGNIHRYTLLIRQ